MPLKVSFQYISKVQKQLQILLQFLLSNVLFICTCVYREMTGSEVRWCTCKLAMSMLDNIAKGHACFQKKKERKEKTQAGKKL